MKNLIAHDRLVELLDYDSNAGVFVRRINVNGSRPKGSPVGNMAGRGYLTVMLDGRAYYLHRLAWFYTKKEWPKHQIDHINQDKIDNRICNLREATPAQNMQNIGAYASNTSGVPGVWWNKQKNKWAGGVRIGGKRHNIGLFSSKEAAFAAYLELKARLHSFQPTVRLTR
jgi:hypothetical protein